MNNEVVFKLLLMLCVTSILFFTIAIKIYFRSNQRVINLSKDKYFDGNNISVHNMKFIVITLVVIFFIALWHLYSLYLGINLVVRIIFTTITIIYFLMYLLSLLYQPYKRNKVDDEYVVVLIPLYNEKEEDFIACLKSIVSQTRLPNEINIVDDGSTIDYARAIKYFKEICDASKINGVWYRQSNKGKRHAQVTGFKNIKRTESIILTIDSDGVLDKNAIENGIIPFNDEKVMSVAGIVVTRNLKDSFLVKIQELMFVSNQIIDRQFMSLFGCVLVNSGAIAFYRYGVIEKALNIGYLNESFNDVIVSYSDNSYLTLAALSLGRCVVQSNSIVYSLMPTNIKQHKRQQLRWQRGAFIRGFWRIKYAKFYSLIFFKQFYTWLISLIMVLLFIYIMVIYSINPFMLFLYLFMPIILYGYLSTTRVLELKRSDMKQFEYYKLVFL